MTRSRIRLPAEFARRAHDIVAGRSEPAGTRDAATVVLLRPQAGPTSGGFRGVAPPGQHGGAGGGFRGVAPPGQHGGADGGPRGVAAPGQHSFEVYLLRRRRSMAFAPGAHVFPGGSVDQRDADADLAWAGPDAAAWGLALACPRALAGALICAAVRETFEESGVLLAGPTAGTVVADTRGDDWEADRRALIDRSLCLAALLRRRGLVLRSDLLRPWARWITPEFESRRFDTRFFAARLPAGQRARDVGETDVGGEADEAVWLGPAAAIAAARRGEMLLMPPTATTLAELARHDSVAASLAADRDLRPRQPGIVVADGTAWLTIPDGVEYPL